MPDPPYGSWKEDAVSIGMTPFGTIGRSDFLFFFFNFTLVTIGIERV